MKRREVLAAAVALPIAAALPVGVALASTPGWTEVAAPGWAKVVTIGMMEPNSDFVFTTNWRLSK